jgi:NodT family efflux transporter outer membrane factor (OMF) lipoprotein
MSWVLRVATPASLLAAGLSGCTTVGPEYAAPVAANAPARYAERHSGSSLLAAPPAAEGAALPADRWAAFGDPTLLALQDRARRNNLDLATAALRLAEVRMQRTTVAAQHGVQVGLRGAITEERQSENGAATRFLEALPAATREAVLAVLREPFTLYQAGFDASWELDLWGRVRRSVEAADAESEAARATLADLQASLVAEVARHWAELRAVQRQIGVLEDERANARDALALIDARRAGGLIDESAGLRQRGVVEDVEARLPPLLDREGEAMRRIERLCGEPPGALATQLAMRPGPKAAAPAATAAAPGRSDRFPRWPDLALGVPSMLVERRPDVGAAAARLHAATASIGVAVADLYPRIVIGASFGSESVGASRFGEWASRQWSIGPSLTLPIFDNGLRRAVVTLREVQQQEAAIAWQQAVLKAWHEVDAAIAGYMAERRRGERLVVRLQASADALALARARRARGLTDELPVLDAERTRLAAERDAVESDGRVGVALVAVWKALGEPASP